MMSLDEARSKIEAECSVARRSRSAGNDGMVRVCARRAAGVAITYWLQEKEGERRGMDAVTQLRALQRDPSIPEGVREAAKRLTARVTEQFDAPYSNDPLEDCRVIIDYVLPPI
jgi:HEPN domain-containing protein